MYIEHKVSMGNAVVDDLSRNPQESIEVAEDVSVCFLALLTMRSRERFI